MNIIKNIKGWQVEPDTNIEETILGFIFDTSFLDANYQYFKTILEEYHLANQKLYLLQSQHEDSLK